MRVMNVVGIVDKRVEMLWHGRYAGLPARKGTLQQAGWRTRTASGSLTSAYRSRAACAQSRTVNRTSLAVPVAPRVDVA